MSHVMVHTEYVTRGKDNKEIRYVSIFFRAVVLPPVPGLEGPTRRLQTLQRGVRFATHYPPMVKVLMVESSSG